MKFEETVLTADGVVQLIFNIIIVKDWISRELAMRCDDIDDMTLKCHVTTQQTLSS